MSGSSPGSEYRIGTSTTTSTTRQRLVAGRSVGTLTTGCLVGKVGYLVMVLCLLLQSIERAKYPPFLAGRHGRV